MHYREGTAADRDAVARLHAESWRHNYRGIYSDEYLDHEVDAERHAAWTQNLSIPRPERLLLLAEDDDGALCGFAYTILDDDPTWGALLDNLHVAPDLKRSGIGTELVARTASWVDGPFYLWVLERNHSAIAFYEARGGVCVERAEDRAPDGTAITGLRYAFSVRR